MQVLLLLKLLAVLLHPVQELPILRVALKGVEGVRDRAQKPESSRGLSRTRTHQCVFYYKSVTISAQTLRGYRTSTLRISRGSRWEGWGWQWREGTGRGRVGGVGGVGWDADLSLGGGQKKQQIRWRERSWVSGGLARKRPIISSSKFSLVYEGD